MGNKKFVTAPAHSKAACRPIAPATPLCTAATSSLATIQALMPSVFLNMFIQFHTYTHPHNPRLHQPLIIICAKVTLGHVMLCWGLWGGECSVMAVHGDASYCRYCRRWRADLLRCCFGRVVPLRVMHFWQSRLCLVDCSGSELAEVSCSSSLTCTLWCRCQGNVVMIILGLVL